MTVMEPRVAERRKTVSEDRARKRLKWILSVIALIALILGSLWLIRSPILSIRKVDVAGATQSDPRSVVNDLEMGIGTPTIDVDGDFIAAQILEDPWVRTVNVEVLWPGSLAIDVAERIPLAPVLSGEQWVLVARDGGVIAILDEPSPLDALVAIDQGSLDPGDTVVEPAVLGALEFVHHLSVERRQGTRIRSEGIGLIAEVQGHRIRLGRAVDMAAKASVLDALLDTGIPDGATINLIAPLRPAVANPQAEVEPEE
jgi:cell division protein FtsQ